METADVEEFEKRKYFKYLDKTGDVREENICDLEYIRNQIHHLGDNPYTKGLVTKKSANLDNVNYYTEKELANAIKKMCEILNE